MVRHQLFSLFLAHHFRTQHRSLYKGFTYHIRSIGIAVFHDFLAVRSYGPGRLVGYR